MNVSDAKKLIEVKYPKLHGRFSYAFNGLPDDMPLKDAVDAIAGDVAGWLGAMPDNFKTSSHAISRPKFGLSYVLQLDDVKAVLGSQYCDDINSHIESVFDSLKKDYIVHSEKNAVQEVGEGGGIKGVEGNDGECIEGEGVEYAKQMNDMFHRITVKKVKFLEEALVSLISDGHGRTLASIFEKLLSGSYMQ